MSRHKVGVMSRYYKRSILLARNSSPKGHSWKFFFVYFSMEAAIFKKLQPVEYQRRFLEKGLRPDGRGIEQFRKASVVAGSISKCQGSATVKIGNSIVVCGIKGEITEPAALTPRQGFFVPNVDLPALCSPKFKPGPPQEWTQSLSQLVDQLFLDVPILNLEQLCIEPNKAVWVLYADIVCLNYDGSILDAVLLSLMAALLNGTRY
jgi:exosome complex component RRP43